MQRDGVGDIDPPPQSFRRKVPRPGVLDDAQFSEKTNQP
jgi:hypothetical protein